MLTEEPMEDILIQENLLIRAETGKRLLNYLVDFIAFYIFAMFVAFVLALVSPRLFDAIEEPGLKLADRLITLVLYAVFMGCCEALFKGKSLGKFLTCTRAINLDGSPISSNTAFLRGFARAVPFCVLSAFGSPCNPWQDKWTNTMVIDEKASFIQ